MTNVPDKSENPKGLHQKYFIYKTGEFGRHIPVDSNAEYFVLRLDNNGKDQKHTEACRIAVNAYADAIKDHLPQLAKDLKERYPANLLQPIEDIEYQLWFDFLIELEQLQRMEENGDKWNIDILKQKWELKKK